MSGYKGAMHLLYGYLCSARWLVFGYFPDELPRTPLWRSSRQRESLHSYTQIVLGAPDEGYSVITTARPSS